MSNILIIGAGGVSQVATVKCAMNADVFSKITLASRTKSKCDAIAKFIKDRLGVAIDTAQIDADDTDAVVALIKKTGAELLLNVALPYQDLTLMDACSRAGIPYIDTANYEHPDTAKFEYKLQWAKDEDFKKAGTMALLGSGFDPGVHPPAVGGQVGVAVGGDQLQAALFSPVDPVFELARLARKTVRAFCGSCVILFSLRSLKAASPVDRASSMRRMSGFDAAAIAKRRREAMPEE